MALQRPSMSHRLSSSLVLGPAAVGSPSGRLAPASGQAPSAQVAAPRAQQHNPPCAQQHNPPCVVLITSVCLAALICAWLLAILIVDEARFVVLTEPHVQVGVEGALALARLFSALVLVLVPGGADARRLHWVAAGFAIQGLVGQLT